MIFFDYEVFKHDWLVVFINPFEKYEKVIVNDVEELTKFYEKNKQEIFVGFNCRSYDSYIFKSLLLNYNPYEVSDWIIGKGKKGWQYSREFNKIYLIAYDVYLGEVDKGLKTLEAFMGLDIHESNVSFDIDRKLTQEEIDETIQYCRFDVMNTMRVFRERIDIFISYWELIKRFNLPITAFNKTRTQLAAMILGAKYLNPAPMDEFDYILPDCLQLGKYQHVLDWFRNPDNFDYSKSLDVEIAGIVHTIGFGGLHDKRTKLDVTGDLLNVDVASYYPNLIRQYGLMSRAVQNKELYNEIITERVGLKKVNKPLADSLKIVLNSTYGSFKDKYNPCYDKRMANSIAISGQLLLIDLIEKLEPYCEILNSNTDGVLVKCNDGCKDKIKELAHEWEARSGMQLEFDEYKRFVSRDVNTYILIDENGKYKCKGAVKELSELDNNLAIINKAIKAYIIDGIPPEEYIYTQDNLIDYMCVCNLKGDYQQIAHIENGELVSYPNKVIRVFASTWHGDGEIGRTREKQTNQSSLESFWGDGESSISLISGNIEKFANTAHNVFINNDDIRTTKVDERLNKEWYIEITLDRLRNEWGK